MQFYITKLNCKKVDMQLLLVGYRFHSKWIVHINDWNLIAIIMQKKKKNDF